MNDDYIFSFENLDNITTLKDLYDLREREIAAIFKRKLAGKNNKIEMDQEKSNEVKPSPEVKEKVVVFNSLVQLKSTI